MAEATHEQPFDIGEVAGGVSDPNAHNPGTGTDDAIAPPENSDELVARRDDVINSMEERIAQHREADNAEQNYQTHPLEQSDQPVPLPGNQGVAQPAPQQQQPAPAAPAPPAPADVQSVQPMHPQAAPATAPTGYEGHPIASHIVMHEGQPYMLMKVGGEDKYVPADRALAHMQKHEAAEIRMDQATAFQRTLQTQSEQLQQGFAELQRQQTELTQAPQPPAAGDPAEYLEEAQSFVTTAFTGSETDAAKQLASLLAKSRGAPVVPAVDPNQIATQAASLAVGQMTADQRKRDEVNGYQQFARDYPDIMGDANLYNMADGMTDRIAGEHPDWLPSQVMQESGNRTRAWLAQVTGQPAPLPPPLDPNVNPQPPAPPAPAQGQPPQYVAQPVIDDRQQRKDGLVVIPQAVTGPQLGPPAPAEDPNQVQSPAEIMAEYRTARGQPT